MTIKNPAKDDGKSKIKGSEYDQFSCGAKIY